MGKGIPTELGVSRRNTRGKPIKVASPTSRELLSEPSENNDSNKTYNKTCPRKERQPLSMGHIWRASTPDYSCGPLNAVPFCCLQADMWGRKRS